MKSGAIINNAGRMFLLIADNMMIGVQSVNVSYMLTVTNT